MEAREKFSSRLGFILMSAGCAIGIGNVWRFPYITGVYGGGAFVLLYLFFLVILGLPIMVMEFAVGRGGQKSAARAFDELEPAGSKWHLGRYFSLAGNYLLMMFYTTVSGWMLAYFVKMAKGDFAGADTDRIAAMFEELTTNRNEQLLWMVIVCILGLIVCSRGLQKGVERLTKIMMSSLFVIMLILMIRALTLDGAMEGLKFYLAPDFSKMAEQGVKETIFAAMGQAFFTLSLGIGALAIFGSYIGKERSLTGEALSIMGLDTLVALMSGLIIFPACFAFDVNPGQGPGLVFVTLPNVFREMPGGRIWGTLFFLFMTFAAFSTVIAVFQNIIQFSRDMWGISLKKSVMINGVLLIVLSIPCVMGLTDWASFTIGGKGILDIEDFLVSNNLLPLGSLIYLAFCVSRFGWGWDKFVAEANAGEGVKFPAGKAVRFYLTYILPLIVLYIFVQGYIGMIKG